MFGIDTAHDEFAIIRRSMVARQIRDRGIRDPRVLDAMNRVPRHAFVPFAAINSSYSDQPLPIGEGQTISQPFMVAAMAEVLQLAPDDRVLEIGAGSGYQAAILSHLVREVTTIETRPRLAAIARERLALLGYTNVCIEEGDGSVGFPPRAPYDAILVSAAAPVVPEPLIDQLTEGGRLAVPVGDADAQQILRITKRGAEITCEHLYHCRFVPLVGRHGWPEPRKAPRE